MLLASVLWDGGGDGVSWHDPLNWDVDVLPMPGDDVVIEVEANPLVEFGSDSGDVQLKSLFSTESITFAGGSLTVDEAFVTHASVTLNPGSLLTADELELLDGGMFILDTAATFGQVHIASGGVLTHSPGVAGFDLTVTSDMIIDAGGAVDANGRGHEAAAGPGSGQSIDVGQDTAHAGGAGHGGRGGSAATGGGDHHGNLKGPDDLGSGGGTASWNSGGSAGRIYEHGGAGGGLIRLEVGGALSLDGLISASGAKGQAGSAHWGGTWSGGGGAGGSVQITADTVGGTGMIAAAGGDAGHSSLGGGGAGGRIALHYDTFDFQGEIHAEGGAGRQAGGAGTLYLKSSSQAYGNLVVDNGGRDDQATTPLLESAVFDSLMVRNRGYLDVMAGIELGVVNPTLNLTDEGEMIIHGRVYREDAANGKFDLIGAASSFELTIADGAQLASVQMEVSSTAWVFLPSDAAPQLTVDQLELLDGGTFILDTSATFGQVHIASGGVLTHTAEEAGFDLTVTGDMVVDAGGEVNGDGRGFAQTSGPGAGANGSGSGGGGGYGGEGGLNHGGSPYGSLHAPVDLGSGGGKGIGGSAVGTSSGGAGGGKVELDVLGMLQLDGRLSADGVDGFGQTGASGTSTGGGGGSGGSIHLTAQSLTGTGSIEADGGKSGRSNRGGGGAGGRIAVYYDSNTFAGTFSAAGGTGVQSAGAGTIFLKSSSQEHGGLIVDNAGEDTEATTPVLTSVILDSLTVRNQGYLDVPTDIEVGLLTASLNLHDAGEMILHGRVYREGVADGRFDVVDVASSAGLIIDEGAKLVSMQLQASTSGEVWLRPLVAHEMSIDQLELLDGGTFILDTSATFGQVHIASGGVLTHTAEEAGFDLTVTGDMVVDAGGEVNGDGRGFAQTSGPGAGANGSGSGGGGGYGGEGGLNHGGSPYGSLHAPVDLGSGGGKGIGGSAVGTSSGGAGGGKVELDVLGMLQLDGRLSANGADGFGQTGIFGTATGGGGGSGGSIHLTAQSLIGTGSIEANGGKSGRSNRGGGGSGGRIRLDYENNTFGGTISVAGGSGVQAGQLGTVWVETPSIGIDAFESFEDGFEGWYSDNGVWQVGAPTIGPTSAYSGNNVAATNLSGQVLPDSMSRLIGPLMVIPATSADDLVLMRYWNWFDFGDGEGQIQVSTLDGTGDWSDWQAVANTSVSGASDGWQRAWADLSDYAGQTVRAAFLYSGGTVAADGWYIDDVELDLFTPPPLPLGTPVEGALHSVAEKDYFSVQVPSGGHLTVTLDDLDDIGANEVYLKHGSLPTSGDFDFRFGDFGGANQQVYVADATPGLWFILVRGSHVPELGSAYSLLVEHGTGIVLTAVTPDHYGAADGARISFEGAGFTPETIVELVRDHPTDPVLLTSSKVDYFSGRRIAADLDLAGLTPADDYVMRVSTAQSSTELSFSVTDPIPAELVANLILPSSVGYHQPATLWVEYENIGEVAMNSPLLVVGAEQNDQNKAILNSPNVSGRQYYEPPSVRGFWTSALPEGYANTIQFLASGSVPGLLQPGEKGRVPVYWAGWQRPWDFGYPDIKFTLGVAYESNQTPIDLDELKETVRPDSLDESTWNGIWFAFADEVGHTWGSYVSMLQDNAEYLGRLGLHVSDVFDLLAFEFIQADGLNLVQTLASSVDAQVTAPGIDLTFSRTYGQTISQRHSLGDLGRGWSHNWEYSLEFENDGTIRMLGPSGSRRTYQPDSRPNRPYFSLEGDSATFNSVAGGYLHVETNGYRRFFDVTGRLEYVEDTNGNRISTTFNGDKLVRLEHSSGQFLTIGWTGDRITSVDDAVGRTTHYAYGTFSDQYLFDVQYYDGSSLSYDYERLAGSVLPPDPILHSLLTVRYPDDSHQFFSWDRFDGRLISISRDNGNELALFSYGDAGEVYIEDTFENTSSYFFNQYGILVRTVDPQGDTLNLHYDLDFNLSSVIDPAGRSYNYGYDTAGNLTKITDPLGYVTRLSYAGPFDRLTGLVDANGNVTRYAYGSSGDLISITYDDGSVESWTYDELGNPDSWTNRRGSPIGYEYDQDGRLTAKNYQDGSRVEYFWDERGNLDYTVDAGGITQFTYDANDYLVRIDYPGDHWLEYTWNVAGQRTSLTNELGDVQHYHYDEVGRLESMADDSGALIVGYEYDAAGRMIRKTLGNGVYTTYDYNDAWELTTLSNNLPDHSILSHFEYEYDSRGRRTAMITTYGQVNDPREDYDGRWEYEYDDLGQLIGWSDPTGHAVTYEYDGLGNRIVVNEDGDVTEYITNNLNQYTTVGGTENMFDLDGNLVREDQPDGSWKEFAYDDENRLVRIHGVDGKITENRYNAINHRDRTTLIDPMLSETANTHVVDPFGLGNVVGIYSSGTSETFTKYTHGIGLISQRLDSGPADWFTFDAVGSVQSTIRDNTYTSQIFDPFGQKVLSNVSSHFGAFGLWGAMEYDDDLSFMRARTYSVYLGSFTSTDPIAFNGPNDYIYAGGNPVSFIDPTGLVRWGDAFWSVVGIAASGVGVAVGVATAPTGIGAVVAVGSAYGVGVNAGNLINALFDQESVLSGGVGEDVGQGVDAVLGNKNGGARKVGTIIDLLDIKNAKGKGRIVVKLKQAGKLPEKASIGKKGFDTYAEVAEQLGIDLDELVEYLSEVSRPRDPNIKTGLQGFGDSRFVSSEATINYRVDFENDETATAPAQIVTISDQLDPSLDWRTFTVTEVGFGDINLSVPAESHHFEGMAKMSFAGVEFEVEIEIGVNLKTGEIYANFYSLDPLTGLPPEANVGFLPPDLKDEFGESIDGRGQGYFNYTIKPLPDVPTGTEIRNIAYITFDGAETIATNQVDPHDPAQGTDPDLEAWNTIDAGKPASHVAAMPSIADSVEFTVQWSGEDDAGGSGVAGYNIYVSENGGTFTPWLIGTPETEAVYRGTNNATYAFYSKAIDNVGHVEAAPPVADAQITVNDVTPPKVLSASIGEHADQRSVVRSIAIEFSENVGQTLTVDDLVVTNLSTGQTTDSSAFTFAYDPTTRTATWMFDGPSLPDGNYEAVILADQVEDGAQFQLDGNADGTGGDDHILEFFRYFGDADGDRDVDFLDLFAFRQTLQATSGDPDYDSAFDDDADGDIDFLDLFRFRGNFQSVLDPPMAGGQQRLLQGDTDERSQDTLPLLNAVSATTAFDRPSMPSILAAASVFSSVRSVPFNFGEVKPWRVAISVFSGMTEHEVEAPWQRRFNGYAAFRK